MTPDMPGWSQIVTLSRCGCLRAAVHGPMVAPGRAEPLKGQNCSGLAWKEGVPLARTFFVCLDFSSVLYQGAVALCLWPPRALSPSRPCCPGGTPMCPSTGGHRACTGECTPQGAQKGGMDCEDPGE